MKDDEEASCCQEMAYIELTDCDVKVVDDEVDGRDENDVFASAFDTQRDSSSTTPQFNINVVSEGPDSQYESRDSLSCHCHYCHLVVRRNRRGDYRLNLNEVAPFRGFANEILHRPCRRARSDAALVIGLLKDNSKYVSIRTMTLGFDGRPREKSCRIWITLAFPFLLKGEPGRRSIIVDTRRDRCNAHNKVVSQSLQLLLSIMRSDWDSFGLRQSGKIDYKPSTAKNTSFFPVRHSIQELYSRIGSSKAAPRLGIRQKSENSFLESLPKELICERICPFLNARSLDALRCTSSSLFVSLRAVVPGLKLRLYAHQIDSLTWMRERERASMCERDFIDLGSSETADRVCLTGDIHRALTCGKTTLLRSREDSSSETAIRIDQESGREFLLDAQTSDVFCTAARGGLLCDEPGLGKSITVLSLILQTLGQSTSSEHSPSENKGGDGSDNDLFECYWNDQVTREFRVPLLNKLVNDLLRHHRGTGFIPADRLKYLRSAICSDSFGASFVKFTAAVEDVIRSYTADDDESSERKFLMIEFKGLVDEFKRVQLKSAKKAFSNSSGRHAHRVSSIIQHQARRRLLDALIPSSGTLLVIPRVLMDHWQSQILSHIDFGYVAKGRIPLVFEFGRKNPTLTVDRVSFLCKVHKSHTAFLFLDKGGTQPLPCAEFLSMFHIVVTTTDRFKNEWVKGSFQKELDQETSSVKASNQMGLYSADSDEKACPLLKVYWLRMIVDEGHSMGKSSQGSTIQFASWIMAQRRWAMTGTPVKKAATETNQIKHLVNFLQHEFLNRRSGGDKTWKSIVSKPWREGSLVSFFRLLSLLKLLMKRHTKFDIAELPPPLFRRVGVSMSSAESLTYNTLVCGVQANILITGMKGVTSGKQDSLLHHSQARHAREALANIRRVCVGWSRVVPTLAFESFVETIQLLEGAGLGEGKVSELREYLLRPEREELSNCQCCSLSLSTLLLFPCCGGLLCTECVDGSSCVCLLCESRFDVDEFQKLQPGFLLTWKSNLDLSVKKKQEVSTKITHESTSLDSDPPTQLNETTIRPPVLRHRTRKFGDGHQCVYDRFSVDGKCTLCFEEHHECILTNQMRRCETCYKISQECPREESKSWYLICELEKLIDRRTLHDERPMKVIVFSQFRQALNVVGDRVLKCFGAACVAEYWGRYRSQELNKFIKSPDCFCMLLGKDGSEGLDLSFVTHIFFLEEIWDASLRDQAVARAWRMGARGAVKVETLVAKNTVEESMQEMEEGKLDWGLDNVTPESDGSVHSSAKEYQRERTRFLLRTCRLITDYHSLTPTFVNASQSMQGKKEDSIAEESLKALSKRRTSTNPRPRKRKKVEFK